LPTSPPGPLPSSAAADAAPARTLLQVPPAPQPARAAGTSGNTSSCAGGSPAALEPLPPPPSVNHGPAASTASAAPGSLAPAPPSSRKTPSLLEPDPYAAAGAVGPPTAHPEVITARSLLVRLSGSYSGRPFHQAPFPLPLLLARSSVFYCSSAAHYAWRPIQRPLLSVSPAPPVLTAPLDVLVRVRRLPARRSRHARRDAYPVSRDRPARRRLRGSSPHAGLHRPRPPVAPRTSGSSRRPRSPTRPRASGPRAADPTSPAGPSPDKQLAPWLLTVRTTSPPPAPRPSRSPPPGRGGVDSSPTAPRPDSTTDTPAQGGGQDAPSSPGTASPLDLQDYSSSPPEDLPVDRARSPPLDLPERATAARGPPSGTVAPTVDLLCGGPPLSPSPSLDAPVAAPPAATPTLPPADFRPARSGHRRRRGQPPSSSTSQSPTPAGPIRRSTPSPLRLPPSSTAAASPPRLPRGRGVTLVFPPHLA
jgi:hypothetical protein